MPKGTIKTTTFRIEDPLSKEEQERCVGEAFRQAYELETGLTLEGDAPAIPDPPDRVFSCQGWTIGAELFELEQFYASRALVENLTNAIYAEFERRELGDRYAGMSAHLVVRSQSLLT